MIISEAPVDNAWYRASIAWFIALMGINCLIWPLLDHYEYDVDYLWWLLVAMPLGSFIFWNIGRFLNRPKRVLLFVTIVGLFGIFPLLIGTLLPILALIFLPSGLSDTSLLFAIIFLAICSFWSFSQLSGLKKRVAAKKFMEKEFKIEKDCIFLSRSPKTNIEPSRLKDSSFFYKLSSEISSKLVFFLPIAYPLQRLFFNAGEVPAVLLLMSIFCLPLTVYIIGKTVCGFYLWIYKVRQLERLYGRPVILAPHED